MRKLIVFNLISLDGYQTGPDNDLTSMPLGGVFDSYTLEVFSTADTALQGRVSYEMFNRYWPGIADDPSPEWTTEQREISRLGDGLQTIVVSDTLTEEQVAPNTRIIRRADAHRQIAELKRQPGKDIVVTGSRTLWNDLLAHGLVDELHLMVGNVILGAGVRAFEGNPDVSLRLIDLRRWEESNNVLLRYEVRH